MLWKNFLIESNDDPENDNANAGYVKDSGGKVKKSSQPKATTTPSKSTPVAKSFGVKNTAVKAANKASFGGSKEVIDETSEPGF